MSISVAFIWWIVIAIISLLVVRAALENDGAPIIIVVVISLGFGGGIYLGSWCEALSEGIYIGPLLLFNGGTMTVMYHLLNKDFRCVNTKNRASLTYVIMFIICGIISYNIYSNHVENFVYDTPVIEETKFVLYDGDGEENSSESNLINIIRYDEGSKKSYYKFYYIEEKENGEIKVLPFEIAESDVEVIIDSNGAEEVTEDYLLRTKSVYYGEYKNAKEPKKLYINTKVTYKLYLRKATFDNMTILIDSEK